MADNFFAQFHKDESAEQSNFFAQFHKEQAPAKGLEAYQVSLPVIGKPSLIGMMKGIVGDVTKGAEITRDVYQGKLDPLSDKAIQGMTGAAALTTMMPSAGRIGVAPKVAPSVVQELQSAATPVYKELTALGNEIPTTIPAQTKTILSGPGYHIAEDIPARPSVNLTGAVKDITDALHPQALRENSAPRTFSQLGELKSAKDLNDVAIVRDHLRDVANGIADNRLIRVTGNDSNAARQSMKMLDQQIENLSPGWTAKMAEADANWAASKRIQTVMKESEKNRLGSFGNNELRAKGFSKEEIAAVKKAHQGGAIGTLAGAVGAGLNPFHGGPFKGIPIAAHLLSAPATHGLSLAGVPIGMAADALAQTMRQRALNNAINLIASKSPLAQKGGVNTGLISLPAPVPPSAGLLPFLGGQNPY